jgi:hypothetical protein
MAPAERLGVIVATGGDRVGIVIVQPNRPSLSGSRQHFLEDRPPAHVRRPGRSIAIAVSIAPLGAVARQSIVTVRGISNRG